MLKVRELIEILKEHEQEMLVLIVDQDGNEQQACPPDGVEYVAELNAVTIFFRSEQ